MGLPAALLGGGGVPSPASASLLEAHFADPLKTQLSPCCMQTQNPTLSVCKQVWCLCVCVCVCVCVYVCVCVCVCGVCGVCVSHCLNVCCPQLPTLEWTVAAEVAVMIVTDIRHLCNQVRTCTPKYYSPTPMYCSPTPKYCSPTPKYCRPTPMYCSPTPKYCRPTPSIVTLPHVQLIPA